MDTAPHGAGRGRKFAVPSPGALADRLGVSVTAVVLGALGVAAAAAGGWWALRPPPGPDPAEILPMADSVPIPTPAPQPTTPDVGRIVVDVVGAVARPGLHELPAGSRIADAVEAAGGLAADADRVRINLAEPLSDGARLWVPAVGESDPPTVVSATAGIGSSGQAGGGGGSGGARGAPLDINTADAAALETLPGIGPALATAIVEHRQRAGPFATVDELVEVSGIGPAKLEQVRALATAGGG